MYVLAAAVVIATCIWYVVRYLFFPLPETGNIPTIPFWVGMLPLFKDVDQQDVFRSHIDTPLRTHGAVKIFFASRWNVLIHRPEYLAEVFKQTDVYEKSGNQKKIPHSLLASFLGDNIISSHGDNWKKYQNVIKPGLQARPNVEKMWENATVLGDLLLKGAVGCKAVTMPANIQRYTICNFAELFLWRRIRNTPQQRYASAPSTNDAAKGTLQAFVSDFSIPRPYRLLGQASRAASCDRLH